MPRYFTYSEKTLKMQICIGSDIVSPLSALVLNETILKHTSKGFMLHLSTKYVEL